MEVTDDRAQDVRRLVVTVVSEPEIRIEQTGSPITFQNAHECFEPARARLPKPPTAKWDDFSAFVAHGIKSVLQVAGDGEVPGRVRMGKRFVRAVETNLQTDFGFRISDFGIKNGLDPSEVAIFMISRSLQGIIEK